jgi:ATP-dependent RNA helicase RhlE
LNFSDFDFHPQVAAGVAALGYITPTPIQAQAMPHVLAGRDVLGLAQTGTGKTAAFALPILQRLINGPRGHVRALIIAPTRELAEQIHTAFRELGRDTGLKSAAIYGGVGHGPQLDRLRRGCEIVVACPGRLLDHIEQGSIALAALEVLVLDEADHMFDMGFLPTIRKILKRLPSERQTLMFSATMPPDIRKLAHEVLRAPTTVEVANTQAAATVTHALYPVAPHLKTALLKAMLEHTDTGSVLVFTRTKHRAKRIGHQLAAAGYKATSIQGNLSQNRRQEAMDGFRSGKYQIMVATDIAARGIDISQVSHVINYDIPDTPEAYTHRIGRTGRAARTGDAFTFVTREDADQVRMIERKLGQPIERKQLEGFDYTAPPASGDEFARPPRQPHHRPRHESQGQPPRGPRHGGHRHPRQGQPRPAQPQIGVYQRPPNQDDFEGNRAEPESEVNGNSVDYSPPQPQPAQRRPGGQPGHRQGQGHGRHRGQGQNQGQRRGDGQRGGFGRRSFGGGRDGNR